MYSHNAQMKWGANYATLPRIMARPWVCTWKRAKHVHAHVAMPPRTGWNLSTAAQSEPYGGLDGWHRPG